MRSVNTDEALPSPGQAGCLDNAGGQIKELDDIDSSLRLMHEISGSAAMPTTMPTTPFNLSLAWRARVR